jgi:hypothetical protein
MKKPIHQSWKLGSCSSGTPSYLMKVSLSIKTTFDDEPAYEHINDEIFDAKPDSVKGINFHTAIKEYFKGKLVKFNKQRPEWKQFLKFAADHGFRPGDRNIEVEVAVKLAKEDDPKNENKYGEVDFRIKHDDGTYSIYEWKRSANTHPTKKRRRQLNKYRRAHEKNGGLNIKGMYLVCFHPELEDYTKVPINRDDVEKEDRETVDDEKLVA